jgi:hypothetical protein
MRALIFLVTMAMTLASASGCAVIDALGGGGGGGDDDDISPTGDAGPLDAPGFYRTVPASPNRDLDVLMVVDNSGSMIAEQQRLTSTFPVFINVIQQLQGGLPNLHLGIVSSNVGAAGATSIQGCTGSGDDGNLLTGPPNNTCRTQFGLQGSFISDIAQSNGTRQKNYTGSLDQIFTCMASLGNTGCGFEMHLESMYRALQPGKNPGFYRDSALLAVIFVADEDDCSTERGEMFGDPGAGLSSTLGPFTSFRCHEFGVRCQNDTNPRALGAKTGCMPDANSAYEYEVQRYIDFMRNLKDDPANIIVAGIVGDFDRAFRGVTVGPDRRTNDPNIPEVARSCVTNASDPDDGASPAIRIDAFIDALSGPTATHSLCASNYSDALIAVGKQLKVAIGNPCIDATLADQDPNQPGLQPACTVVSQFGTAITPITQCSNAVQASSTCDPGTAGTPCWCLHTDAQICPASETPSSLALGINTGGASPPIGTKYLLYCRT